MRSQEQIGTVNMIVTFRSWGGATGRLQCRTAAYFDYRPGFIWPATNEVQTGGTPQYADLKAQHFSQPPKKVFSAALAVARATGWEIAAQDRIEGGSSGGEIRAISTTALWHFKDDVTITIGRNGDSLVVNVHFRS